MDMLCSPRRSVALLVLLLLTGCSSTEPTAQPRFREEAAADLVVNFPGWQYTSITRPDTTEGGFMPFYDRVQVQQALAHLKTGHNLAVVVVSHNYTPEQDLEHRQTWSSILGGLGYRRIVFLRAGVTSRLNGLRILEDVQLQARVPTSL